MSLPSDPQDFLDVFPGWVTSFELQFRQELSRTAGGVTIVKDMGDPLWNMSARTKILPPNKMDYWRARLESLENGRRTFYGYSLSRKFPILYPNGSWPTGSSFNGYTAQLYDVDDATRRLLRISSLPAAFRLSVGDMVSINDTDLHRVQEDVTANGSGLTPAFEVYPRLWAGIDLISPLPRISVLKPHCRMMLVPGSVSSSTDMTGWGTIAFEAIEARQ